MREPLGQVRCSSREAPVDQLPFKQERPLSRMKATFGPILAKPAKFPSKILLHFLES